MIGQNIKFPQVKGGSAQLWGTVLWKTQVVCILYHFDYYTHTQQTTSEHKSSRNCKPRSKDLAFAWYFHQFSFWLDFIFSILLYVPAEVIILVRSASFCCLKIFSLNGKVLFLLHLRNEFWFLLCLVCVSSISFSIHTIMCWFLPEYTWERQVKTNSRMWKEKSVREGRGV